MPKTTYIFVENLPKLATKQELITYFTSVIQEPREVHTFVFHGKNVIYDLQAALLGFKFDNPAKSIDKLNKTDLILNNYKLQIAVQEDITQFRSTALIYDIDQKTYDNYLLPFLKNMRYQHMGQVITPPSQLLGFIVKFFSTENLDRFITLFYDIKIKPLVSDPRPSQFVLNLENADQSSIISQFDPIYLYHRGKKYTVPRIYASRLSDLIKNTESNSITLPDIEGPIELIIDFLNLKKIIITPETERFLFELASFLKIPDIISKLSPENTQTLSIKTAPWMIHNIQPNTKQAEDLSIFLASNIEDLVDNKQLADIPEYYLQKIITLAAPELESHDSLIQLLIDAKVEAPVKKELVKLIDPKKVSSNILAKFFLSVPVDLNKLRQFIVDSIFD